MLDLSAFHQCYFVEGGLCAGDSGFPALSIEALWTCDRVTGTTSLGHVQQSVITASSHRLESLASSCHGPGSQHGVPLKPFCVWVPVVVIWCVLRFWFTWTLRFVNGAGSAVVWVCEGVRLRVGSWAENIITAIAIDVWYLLHLVHGADVLWRHYLERACATFLGLV